MTRLLLITTLLFSCLFLLPACGQSGKLYLPDQQEKTQ